jgi:hypothetical protein
VKKYIRPGDLIEQINHKLPFNEKFNIHRVVRGQIHNTIIYNIMETMSDQLNILHTRIDELEAKLNEK